MRHVVWDWNGTLFDDEWAHVHALVDVAGDVARVLVVGDALDDAATDHVGARCVLFDGGSHPRSELGSAGVPVASPLVEALELAVS